MLVSESLATDIKIFKTTFTTVSCRRDLISNFRVNCVKMFIKRICQVTRLVYRNTAYNYFFNRGGVTFARCKFIYSLPVFFSKPLFVIRFLYDPDVTVNFVAESFINSPQSCGFFERIAFNFMMSLK